MPRPNVIGVLGLALFLEVATVECAVADEVTVAVHGGTHAIFGGYYANAVFFSMPAETRCVVRASGAASWALDRPFGGVILAHRMSSACEFVAIPVGVPVEVVSGSGDTQAQLFFADETLTDNSGALEVSITPDTGAPLAFTVDAVVHCVPVERARTLDLARTVLSVQASGIAFWAGPSYRDTSVVLMYDVPTSQTRHFATVPLGGPPQPFGSFAGGRLWLFFADLSTIWGDNGGEAVVTFTLESPVGVQTVPWGAVKQQYARPTAGGR